MKSIPAGYKQTEVGAIPEDWEIVKLSKHVTFKTGPFGSALHKSDYVDGGVPVINPMQIVSGKIEPTWSMAITERAARNLTDFRLSFGNIVIGRRGEMGRCAFVEEKQDGWLCGTGSMIIRTAPSIDARFLQRVLSSPVVVSAIENASVGTTMVNLNQGTLGNLVVPLPPTKAEQEAIAEALSDTDALIESLEQLIAKKRDLKQGTMQELLTGKKRLPGFSGEWEIVPLGSLINSLDSGVSVNSVEKDKDFFAHDESILKTSCVIGGKFIPEEHKQILPSDIHRAKLNPRKDSIIFSRMNTPALVGECGYVDRDYPNLFIPDRLWMTRFGGPYSTCARWLAYLLSFGSFNQAIKETATGTSGSMKNISQGSLLSVHIPLPTEPEQTAIAAILSDMDAEIAALETKLAKTRQLKQGMMHNLLTGRIRLL